MIRPSLIASLLALALPLAGLGACAETAFAQAPPPAAPAKAPSVVFDGIFARHVLSPRGEITGLLLGDGTVVHVPHHAGAATGAAGGLKAGAVLHVEGRAVRTSTGTLVTRALIKQNGAVIADGSQGGGRHGHQGKREKREHARLAAVAATGKVQAVLAGPQGHVHAVLLDDGTTASGAGMDGLGLKVGDRVSVAGKGGAYPQGKALRIETITLPSGETRTLPHKGRHHRRGAQGAPV